MDQVAADRLGQAEERRMKARDIAMGKWQGILAELGVDPALLDGKNRPCPLCGGKDRFRLIDIDGRGSWVCNQCQPETTDGFNLAQRVSGMDFKAVAQFIESRAGAIPQTHTEKRDPRPLLRSIYSKCRPLVGDCTVTRYLESRGLPSVPMLREARLRRSDDGIEYDTMAAMVTDVNGKSSTYHLTYLDGAGKAAGTARKMMPTVSAPSAVRLHPIAATLGIAEGIETALAAWHWTGIPTWAALNASLMAKWVPPAGVEEVIVFADNDENYTGQRASYTLANRLALIGIGADVWVPRDVGTDFADRLKP